jgi:hypothetical protein
LLSLSVASFKLAALSRRFSYSLSSLVSFPNVP